MILAPGNELPSWSGEVRMANERVAQRDLVIMEFGILIQVLNEVVTHLE